MAQLAIKGHATRGKEVIKILKMLGGYNIKNWIGDDDFSMYFINEDGNIICSSINYSIMKVFTLEEFIEKFPYKVGDKVHNIIHNENQEITALAWDFKENEVVYQTNNNEYVYVNYLQPHKEETMEEKEQIIINIPNGYKFFGINDENKVVLTKIQPQYPKTFVDCCAVLYPNENFQTVSQPIKGHNGKKLFVLQKLLICRDAYWKITMDWEPNWEDETDIYYTISYDGVNIKCYNNTDVYSKFAFPTEEMRDAFYENFKDLIETCKELL